jgi:hypothetical protein
MGGAACAKEVLCWPAAVARAENESELNRIKGESKERLKLAMLQGLKGIGAGIRDGSLGIGPKQIQCYHDVMAVLDKDDKTFSAAYDELRLSLIVFA